MSNSTFKKSRRLPLWVKLLITSLATILAVTLLGSLSTGFTDWNVSDWFDKEVNDANLVQAEALPQRLPQYNLRKPCRKP